MLKLTSKEARRYASKPRVRTTPRGFAKSETVAASRGAKRMAAAAPPATTAAASPVKGNTAFSEDLYLANKQAKEKHLADRARLAAEREAIDLAARRGELVTTEEAQRALEQEHQLWLTAMEDMRQAINKKVGKAGLPMETQEAISEIILKEITEARRRRAVAK